MACNPTNDESVIELPSASSDGVSNDDNVDHQVDFIHQERAQNLDRNRRFVIVTAGKAGIGKSTLINNFLQLVGDAVFEARPGPNSVTRRVDFCDREINGIQVRVVDMPGFNAADTGVVTDTREDIILDLQAVTEEGEGVDVVFYCISLMNRLENVDYENINTLITVFGSNILEHFIFVFTYTDHVLFDGSSPEESVEEYIRALRSELVVNRRLNVEIRSINSFPDDNMVSEDAEINNFDGIVGIPVSKNPAIPENWRITLLLQVIRKCRRENIPALLKLNGISWNEVKKTTAIVAASGIGGAAVGTVVGASIGALVGGLATAPVGGVGAIPTAAGGAALGAWIGTLSGSGALGLTALGTRIAFIMVSRDKIETRARLRIGEMLERERRRTAQESSVENQAQA